VFPQKIPAVVFSVKECRCKVIVKRNLEELLQTRSEKDLPDMRFDGVESIYWAGTESGLIDIYNFPGVIYATDGSKSSTGMGAPIPVLLINPSVS